LRRHHGWTRRNKMGVVPRHEIAEPASIAIRRVPYMPRWLRQPRHDGRA
jgi:hypothetical protein